MSRSGSKVGEKWVLTHFTHFCTQKPTFYPLLKPRWAFRPRNKKKLPPPPPQFPAHTLPVPSPLPPPPKKTPPPYLSPQTPPHPLILHLGMCLVHSTLLPVGQVVAVSLWAATLPSSPPAAPSSTRFTHSTSAAAGVVTSKSSSSAVALPPLQFASATVKDHGSRQHTGPVEKGFVRIGWESLVSLGLHPRH